MSIQEAYVFLFADSLMSSLILPLQENLVFPAMKIFGGYNTYIIIAIASFGAVIGTLANWVLGRMITTISKYRPSGMILKSVELCRNNAVPILALAWIPFLGSAIAVFMGFAGVKLRVLLPTVLLINLVYCSISITQNIFL